MFDNKGRNQNSREGKRRVGECRPSVDRVSTDPRPSVDSKDFLSAKIRRKAGAKFAHTSGPSRDHPKTSQTKKLAKNAPKFAHPKNLYYLCSQICVNDKKLNYYA